jgi:hypothetical protein
VSPASTDSEHVSKAAGYFDTFLEHVDTFDTSLECVDAKPVLRSAPGTDTQQSLMLTSETKRRIDACRNVLVGKLPQPSNQVELITLALIYKFMDDLDEESEKLGGKRSFFVNGLTKFRWRALMPQTLSADDRMTLFAGGIETLGHPKKAGTCPACSATSSATPFFASATAASSPCSSPR